MNNYLAKKYVVQGSHSELGLLHVVSLIFVWEQLLEVIFKLFFLTDVNPHCVERRTKLLIKYCLTLKYQEIYVATFEM